MSDDQHKNLKHRDVTSNPRPSQAPRSSYSAAQVGPLELGSIVGGSYRILEFIGQGGMGFVYKVEHLMMAKTLALKVLRPEQVSESTWKRFRIEAQAIARLNHPNVIRTYDMNQTESGLPFYTMDLLIGLSLADYLDSCEELSLKEALPVFRQVCSGLAHAHDRGIIHRDIKPANIMLVSDNSSSGLPVVKIVDFGIAKFSTPDGPIDQGLTQQGEVCGSPVYMSPEQCAGMPLNHRTDMYSLGVTMFQALTGKLPLLGKTAIQTAVLHQSVVPPRLSEVADGKRFPSELEQIVARLLEKSPDDRYDSLATVSHELLAIERRREGARSAIAAVKLPIKTPLPSALESRQVLQDESFNDRREEQQEDCQEEHEQEEADDRKSYWSDQLQDRFVGRKRIVTSSRFVILCSLLVTALLVIMVVAVVVRSLYKFRAPVESRNRLVAPC